MSRQFDSLLINGDVTLGSDLTLTNSGGFLSINSPGSSFIVSPAIYSTGPVGPTGAPGLSPTGAPGTFGNFTIETVSGTSTINPNINNSILNGSTNYTLSYPSINGALKYVVDDVTRSNPAYRIVTYNGTGLNPITTGASLKNNGVNGQVLALAIDTVGSIGPTGNLYAGGLFNLAGGTVANRIARWDGSQWNPLATGIGVSSSFSQVNSLAFDTLGKIGTGGYLYASGVFSQAGSVAVTSIAGWNGTSWFRLGTGSGLDSGSLTTVNSIVFDNIGTVGPTGYLYAGGTFQSVDGTATARYITRYNGTGWIGLFPGPTPIATTIYSNMVIDNVGVIGTRGFLYYGGSYTVSSGRLWQYNGSSQNIIGTFDLILGPNVYSLIIDEVGVIGPTGNLYAGGRFTRVTSGVLVNNIARWNGSVWSPLGTGVNNDVYSLMIDNLGRVGPTGHLYAGGLFTTAGGTAANRIARWDGSQWYPLGSGFGNGVVSALTSDQVGVVGPTGTMYVGGSFTTLSTLPTVSVGGDFYSGAVNTFYNTIRTTDSDLGRQQGLIWVDDIGAWTVIDNNQIFSYTNV